MATKEYDCTKRSRRRATPALVISVIALIVALSGTGVAVAAVAANSVGNAQLKTDAVTTTKIKLGGVYSSDVRNGSLLRSDFASGQLATGSYKVYNVKIDVSPFGATGPHVTGATKVNTGIYDVAFDFNTSGCSSVASSISPGRVVAAYPTGSSVTVYQQSLAGAYNDEDVSLVVVC